MSAIRPVILAALKAVLVANVTAVNGRVYLPWDNQPDLADAPLLQIEVDDAQIDDAESMGVWVHTLPVRIGAVKTGKFDYQTTWDLLATVTSTLLTTSVSGCQRVDVSGSADSVTVAGDKLLWPHINVDLVYLTTAGTI